VRTFRAAACGSIMAAIGIGSCNAITFSTNTNAIADAFVTPGATGSLSSSNFGGGGALGLAANGLPLGEFQTVLKFGLSDARNTFDTQLEPGRGRCNRSHCNLPLRRTTMRSSTTWRRDNLIVS